MLKAFHRLLIFILPVLIFMTTTGCGSDAIPREKGNVQFAVNLPTRSISSGARYFVEMVNGSSTKRTELTLVGSIASGSISNIYVGEWDVTAYIEDAPDHRTHEGKGKVLITPGATASCQLKIAPIKGSLKLTFAPSSLGISEPLGSAVLKIGFENLQADEYYFTGSPGEVASLSASDLAPTTYPYVIEIYDTTGNRIYVSPQGTVDIASRQNRQHRLDCPDGGRIIDHQHRYGSRYAGRIGCNRTDREGRVVMGSGSACRE